jgi:crotonobetainyl-CoA:carnitine CoA-transferase CaiB-like acyl-CoA transferase
MPAVPIADMAAGLQAALAVLSGLRLSDPAHAIGFRADVAMLDSALSLTALGQGAVVATGEGPPTPDVLTGGLACYSIYRCADGLELAVGALEPQFFARLAELVGDPSLADLQYDITGQDALRGRLTQLFAARRRQDWLDLLEADQTCVTPVRSAAEALSDPDLRDRGVLEDIELADGVTATAARSVAWLPDSDRRASRPAPGLGADAVDILIELGLDPEGVRASGALG